MSTFDFEESREEYQAWIKKIEALSIPSTFSMVFNSLIESPVSTDPLAEPKINKKGRYANIKNTSEIKEDEDEDEDDGDRFASTEKDDAL
jgi:hypothetical protein